jgi:hypothetical protein
MGPTHCPETSVNNYHTTLCNTPEERRYHQHRGGSLKSMKIVVLSKLGGSAYPVTKRRIPEERMRQPHVCENNKTAAAYYFSRNLCSMWRNDCYCVNYHKACNSRVCVELCSVVLTCCAQCADICLRCYLCPLPKAIVLQYDFTAPVYLTLKDRCEFDSLVFTTGKVQFIYREALRAMTTRTCDLTIYRVFFIAGRPRWTSG